MAALQQQLRQELAEQQQQHNKLLEQQQQSHSSHLASELARLDKEWALKAQQQVGVHVHVCVHLRMRVCLRMP
jgi:hypothetical protein